jgi:hypothetical protein
MGMPTGINKLPLSFQLRQDIARQDMDMDMKMDMDMEMDMEMEMDMNIDIDIDIDMDMEMEMEMDMMPVFGPLHPPYTYPLQISVRRTDAPRMNATQRMGVVQRLHTVGCTNHTPRCPVGYGCVSGECTTTNGYVTTIALWRTIAAVGSHLATEDTQTDAPVTLEGNPPGINKTLIKPTDCICFPLLHHAHMFLCAYMFVCSRESNDSYVTKGVW